MSASKISISALLTVLCMLGVLVLVVFCGVFDGTVAATNEIGFQNYAEKTWRISSLPLLGDFEIMPANSAVNFLYVIVGCYWMTKVSWSRGVPGSQLNSRNPSARRNHTGHIPEHTLFFLQCFSTLLVSYGFVQLSRIVTQRPRLTVLDQWVTLPFFSWLACWCYYQHEQSRHNITYAGTAIPEIQMLVLLNVLSLSSYFLTLISDVGFEISLCVHILVTIRQASRLQLKCGTNSTLATFLKGCLACMGFVSLKLYDKELALLFGTPFTILTGHFWSKICDVLQFHYACVFVCEITMLTNIK